MEEKSKLEVTLIGEADPDASASSSSSSSAEQVAAMLHESESESEKKIESDDSEMVKKTESASVSFLFSEPAIRFWFCRKLIRVWFCFAKQSESEKGDIVVETEDGSESKTAVLGPPGPKMTSPLQFIPRVLSTELQRAAVLDKNDHTTEKSVKEDELKKKKMIRAIMEGALEESSFKCE
ncbi:uncharacterized protein LOC112191972 isoform X1 [Rosa chinensis]|uniref:uncharacterized protein LOC112193523 isoform X1 n=1 Tax=Rosa chinensis TaxID=74649 RepID=UPI001AD8AF09|nr:uncharacterized protein LOC112193523 isoform X1 [Rosa chinensis]XP_040372023.1 uncharacterized protein LOC112193523 isoform X1 [Rosa chinensis]XP_040372747.1 uncharacterized protein LOC112193860 isoform X1 [Rosa chinensis]XP_040372784.1 uncharacterized protein LOC112191972 isoform X1 [Rosa chinensis]XP_040372785.1 uncharacterized protein LOC112191972 isoform X1 [Rosa chinensis]